MDHRDTVHFQLLELGAQSSVLLEPANALLDAAPAAIELAVEPAPTVVGTLIAELRALVDVPGGEVDREGEPETVSHQVELAAESAAQATQCVVEGLFGGRS